MASLRIRDSSTDQCLPHLPMRYSTKTRQVGLKTDTKIWGRNEPNLFQIVQPARFASMCDAVHPVGKGLNRANLFVSRHTRRTQFTIDLAAGETTLGVSGTASAD